MTVINRGVSGEWYVFRGSDAQEFLANIIVVASWPCRLKRLGEVVTRARLFGHDTGTFSLVTDSDNIPEGFLKEYYHHFVREAKLEIARKHAAN